MGRLEFPLAQGWARGLSLVFEDAASSAALSASPDFGRRFWEVEQVHGREIFEVGESDLAVVGTLGKADGLVARGDWFKGCGRALLVKSADCAPLIYVDHLSQCLVILHAGWRGLQQGIHRLPFERGWLDPASTWAWIGPCLNGRHFEVGEDMWSQFAKYKSDAEVFEAAPGAGKRYFHSWRFIQKELAAIGVPMIYNVETDTFEDRSFASYRRAQREASAALKARNLSWVGFV